mgnify:CR=1 FL=1
MKVYKETLKLHPNQTSLYLTAGDFCLKHNLLQQAEGLFSKAININEKHIHLYNRLGIALRRQSKYREAIKNYDKALKIKPDDAILHYNQAKALFYNREELNATDIINKAFKIDPDLITKFKKDKYFVKLRTRHPSKFKF